MLTIKDQSYGTGTWLFWEDGLTEDLENQIAHYSNLLGIHLSVENPSATGLTLVCHQDGTLVEQLNTGTPYSISRWEDGLWVPLDTAENTAWTMEAFVMEIGSSTRWNLDWSWIYGNLSPGKYRISKSFSGKLPELGTVTALIESTDQTFYAEFVIE